MPFDLPPPVPPMQAGAAALEQRYRKAREDGDVIVHTVGPYRLLISGNSYLARARILQVVGQAKTPSQAVRLLNALYRADGHPLVTVQYAASGKTIYVQVNDGYITDLQAPDLLRPFFADLVGKKDVDRSDIEPRRLLAKVKADRAGYDVKAKYRVDPEHPRHYTLKLDGKKQMDYYPVTWTTTFGNPGNRFLGRYFGFTNLKARLPNGDIATLGYGTAFTGLGDPRNGTGYDRYSLSYSTVNAWGLYSLSGSYTEYGIRDRFDDAVFDNEREKAQITNVKLAGNQFLYADRATRLVVEEQLQYLNSTVEFTDGQALVTNGRLPLAGRSVQDEEYGAGRLGLTLSHSLALAGQTLSLTVGGGYKHGFGGHVDDLIGSAADRTPDFALYDGKFTARYVLPGGWSTSVHAKGQLADNDTVPEQQQWVLGGSDNLSAFLPGTLVGDSGAYARAQVRTPSWFLLSRPLRLTAFVEQGTAQFENRGLPYTSASDYGVELEISPVPHLEISAYVADALATNNFDEVYGEDFSQRQRADFYFKVKTTF